MQGTDGAASPGSPIVGPRGPSRLSVEYLPLSGLQAAPRNPKVHDVEALTASLGRFGFVAPVIVDDATGRLVAGHGRVEALECAKAAGARPPDRVRVEGAEWLVPVIRGVEFAGPREAEAYLLADNQLAMGAGWGEGLEEMLRELRDADALAGTGFTDADLAKLLGSDGTWSAAPEAEMDRAAELTAKWGTARPQLWQAGPHRILCGDATSIEDVGRLLGGERASMLWTDPPYGVEYVGKTAAALTIANDDAPGLTALLAGFLAAVTPHLILGAPFYIAHPAGALSVVFGEQVLRAGWRLHQTLIWVKHSMVLGHTDYHYRHEPILYGYTPGPGRPGRGDHQGTRWAGDNAQTSVFEIDRPVRSDLHPTMKPPALIARCLDNSSRPGEIVLDPFSGSGSTLAAAEMRRRRGYGIEIDPKYVAVILERLASMGLTPERLT
jgi:site-specific DNA-methyltransferase (adenine-specific)